MKSVTLYVQGMTCSHCENTVKTSLLSQEGVKEVKVELSTGVVRVSYEPSVVEIDRLQSTVDDAGYVVSRVE